MQEIFYYNSPIGILKIIIENDYLVFLDIDNASKETYPQSELAKNIRQQLNEYFSGKRKNFNIKYKFNGTMFQQKVWKELVKIPYGETKSYKDIAISIKNENSQRAVGGACNKNQILIIVPCHRVISKNKNLGGFACGVDIKKKLLNIENTECLYGNKVDNSRRESNIITL